MKSHFCQVKLLRGNGRHENKTRINTWMKYLFFPQVLLLFHLYHWYKHRIRLLFLFFFRKKKHFTSLITFSFSATFIANRFLNHHVSLFPMLPLTGFNQMSFTTVKTNVSPHPLKHIWKRAVKKIYQIKNKLWRLFSCTWESASNMHFKN